MTISDRYQQFYSFCSSYACFSEKRQYCSYGHGVFNKRQISILPLTCYLALHKSRHNFLEPLFLHWQMRILMMTHGVVKNTEQDDMYRKRNTMPSTQRILHKHLLSSLCHPRIQLTLPGVLFFFFSFPLCIPCLFPRKIWLQNLYNKKGPSLDFRGRQGREIKMAHEQSRWDKKNPKQQGDVGELPYKEMIPRCSGWKRRHLGDDPLILIFTPCWPEKEACGHNHCSLLKEGYDEGSCTPSPGRPLGFLQKFMCLPHCFYPTSQLMKAGKGSVLCWKRLSLLHLAAHHHGPSFYIHFILS